MMWFIKWRSYSFYKEPESYYLGAKYVIVEFLMIKYGLKILNIRFIYFSLAFYLWFLLFYVKTF